MVRSNIIETPAEANVVPSTAPVKTKKSKKTTASEETVEPSPVVATPSVETEESSTPVPAVKVSKKKSKASAVEAPPATEDVPSVTENVVVTPSDEVVVPETVDETGEVGVADLFSAFTVKLTGIHASLSALKNDLRVLEKRCNKDMKSMLKKSSKNKKRNPNRAPSGFVKPALISEELATFLGKPLGTEMARTSVTKEINQYIKEKSLGDKTNGRHIIPDEALSTLLKLQPGDELTYFNLQRFMSHHFSKSDSSKVVESSKIVEEPSVTV
jgi:chromatin remodeling complex protein RSC6